MSRTLPTGFATAMAAASVAPVFLVEVDWPTGTVYAWNGYADLSWNGKTWIGVGHLGSISEIKESSDLSANGMVLTMSGIPTANVAEVLAQNSQGRPGKVYFGVIANDGFSIDPYLIFDGFIDVAPLNDDGKTATISVALEKEFYDNRTNARRYTHSDQQIDFPGDLGLQYVAGLAVQQFTWGKATVYPSSPGGGGGDDGLSNIDN